MDSKYIYTEYYQILFPLLYSYTSKILYTSPRLYTILFHSDISFLNQYGYYFFDHTNSSYYILPSNLLD